MTPDADKKTLSQATGIPTTTEALVEKACRTALSLADAVLTKRGLVPAEVKTLAETLLSGPRNNKEALPEELKEPPTTLPDAEPETGSDEAEDRNPGHLTFDDVSEMTKGELRTIAKDCGLSTQGTKTDLFNDVVTYLGLAD